MIRIHRIIRRTKAEGPGTRLCIWVQGCSHHCEGCFAEATWDANGGIAYEESAIIEIIRNEALHIEGITLLGGEPFEQAEKLAGIAQAAHSLGLSVMTFTGYSHEQLIESHDNDIMRLLAATDLLVDGRYEKALRDFSRPWVGSSNQRFIFLSDRYDLSIEGYANCIEICVDKNGVVRFNGMGGFTEAERLINY